MGLSMCQHWSPPLIFFSDICIHGDSSCNAKYVASLYLKSIVCISTYRLYRDDSIYKNLLLVPSGNQIVQ